MPITELTPDSIQHVCAVCQEAREVPFAMLTAGIQHAGRIDPYIIALPACTACGASEFLIRTPSAAELERVIPGSHGHLHRLLVDRVHQRLVDSGRLVEGAASQDLKPLPPLEPALEEWISSNPKLPPLPAADPDSQSS